MSHPDSQSCNGKNKGARHDGRVKLDPGPIAPPLNLPGPPPIAETIRRYFVDQPGQGERVLGLISGNGGLVRAWEAFARAGLGERFWGSAYDWLRIIDDKDLPGFFKSLDHAISRFTPAKQLVPLRADQRKNPLILHVDDDDGVRTLVEVMVSQELNGRASVASVGGCAGGLLLASLLLPDMVLTDVMEPGMDGFTFAGYLKKNPATRQVPFVFLTARRDIEAITTGARLGAKTYITKPFLPRELMPILRSILGIERGNPGSS